MVEQQQRLQIELSVDIRDVRRQRKSAPAEFEAALLGPTHTQRLIRFRIYVICQRRERERESAHDGNLMMPHADGKEYMSSAGSHVMNNFDDEDVDVGEREIE
jgi:hypothetical protein